MRPASPYHTAQKDCKSQEAALSQCPWGRQCACFSSAVLTQNSWHVLLGKLLQISQYFPLNSLSSREFLTSEGWIWFFGKARSNLKLHVVNQGIKQFARKTSRIKKLQELQFVGLNKWKVPVRWTWSMLTFWLRAGWETTGHFSMVCAIEVGTGFRDDTAHHVTKEKYLKLSVLHLSGK